VYKDNNVGNTYTLVQKTKKISIGKRPTRMLSERPKVFTSPGPI
jgi:hypothetical protein